jgi:hypothetical protein
LILITGLGAISAAGINLADTQIRLNAEREMPVWYIVVHLTTAEAALPIPPVAPSDRYSITLLSGR